nr:MAG TPA: hypothetical protein [Caudoviricetes sp.]DAW10458.1 MAG TPA: hypothetical protein [Caudoviricetes sp.]DAZ75650.1 MAG TPA: hypothetical protein [Caudoviricetes sp.]
MPQPLLKAPAIANLYSVVLYSLQSVKRHKK